MKDKERSTTRSTDHHEGKPAELHEDGVLDSLGKAITAPIAGASRDELLPDEDLPAQRKSDGAFPSSATPKPKQR